VRLALAQINPTIGDLAGSAAMIARRAEEARSLGADLVVFPELCLTGYPPKDLLMQEGFLEAVSRQAKELGQSASRGVTLVFGLPRRIGEGAGSAAATAPRRPGITNSLEAWRDGKLLASYDKRLLPTYDVFDEDRYFVPGDRPVVIEVAGTQVGLSICEDLWKGYDVGLAQRYEGRQDPVEALVAAGAQLIVNPSASPFVLGKGRRHRDLLRTHALRHRVWVAGVNQVGGNDELVFDGHAAVYTPSGELAAAAPGFEEAVLLCDIAAPPPRGAVADPLLGASDEELLFRALVLGVRDYLRKTGFKSAVLGLSGGIDSAVTGVLAAAAIGGPNVLALNMPSMYSSEGSRTDARELAARLGMRLETIPIDAVFTSFLASLDPLFAGRPADVAEENIQARIRGTLLMAASNKFGHILLTTGNKSELAVGYCTLYGDMNGGLAVLSDVSKQWVYALARWMNANPGRLWIEGLTRPPIPEASITKPPSAELRPNQMDQDTLPPYPVLDEIIERYVERRQDPGRIVRETGFDGAVVARSVRMIDVSEYKRKQAAIGLKVTGVAFGSGRRMPIAQGWRGSTSERQGA
jgi:NAD+ synthetase